MVWSMIGFANLPIFFWRYALEIAYYILYKVLSKSIDKTLYEIWTGRRPVFSHLRVYKYLAYVKHLKIDKLRPKFDKCLFVEYSKKTKRCYFYLAEEQKMFINNRAVFSKKKFLGEGANANKIKLDEFHKVEELAYIESDLIEKSNLEPVKAPLRRSNRILRQLDRYYSFLIRDSDPIELDENDEDLITYMEAM